MINQIQEKITEAIKHLDNRLAWEVLTMASKDSSIKLEIDESLKLKYIRMSSMSPEQILNLLSQSVLVALAIPDFNLFQRIVDYVENLEYVPDQVEFIKMTKAILDDHQEILGQNNINVSGKMLKPSIGNWLKDYEEFTLGRSFSTLEQLKYFNTAPNPRTLSPENKEYLRVIVKLYDLLSEYSKFWDSLPKELSDSDQEELDAILTKLVSQIVSVENREEEEDEDSEESYSNVSDAVDDQALRTSSTTLSANSKSVDSVQTLISKNPTSPQEKRGLVFDTPTNVDMDEIAKESKKADQAQQKIANKLEELKKRKDQKNNTKQE